MVFRSLVVAVVVLTLTRIVKALNDPGLCGGHEIIRIPKFRRAARPRLWPVSSLFRVRARVKVRVRVWVMSQFGSAPVPRSQQQVLPTS